MVYEILLRLAKALAALVLGVILYVIMVRATRIAGWPELALLEWISAAAFILLCRSSPDTASRPRSRTGHMATRTRAFGAALFAVLLPVAAGCASGPTPPPGGFATAGTAGPTTSSGASIASSSPTLATGDPTLGTSPPPSVTGSPGALPD